MVRYRKNNVRSAEFSLMRKKALSLIRPLVDAYVGGKLGLPEFNAKHARVSVERNFWGFPAFSGQLFLNQLIQGTVDAEELSRVLAGFLALPGSLDEAIAKMERAVVSIEGIHMEGMPFRRACLPYFASYFWQVKNPQGLPVFYASSRDALVSLGYDFVAPSFLETYRNYCRIYIELASGVVSEHRFWEVEYALLYSRQKEDE